VKDRLLLFVVLREGVALDEQLQAHIRELLRRQLSPRHVPDRIAAVPEVPRTLNGKKLEVPVKRLLEGVPLQRAVSTAAVVNPDALAPFAAMAASGS
jgi:acetoacetyl-CoA synthetase